MFMTRKQLELEICRIAEKYPDNKYVRGNRDDLNLASHHLAVGCLIATILRDQYGHEVAWGPGSAEYINAFPDSAAFELAERTERLNDAGNCWGDIPRLLGLVPGEQPASQPKSVIPEPLELVHA